jgi:LCP family protein required for cell wall assembly
MSRLKLAGLAVLILIAAALWASIGWDYYQKAWQKPLGPQLALPGTSPEAVTAEAATRPPGSAPIFGTVTYIPKIVAEPLCGGPKTMTLLAIGSDTRAGNYLYGLADVIRYVRFDFMTPRVSVLEFPRDLWVEIPGIDKHYGITHGKLNQAYFYGNPGMGYYQGAGQGPGLLARTLDLNFGAAPDHYIAANMQTFVHLVDVIGGLDVFLPYSVDARKPDQQKRADLYFAPGPHHLNGEQALMLGRIREYSVFARADQQNRILCAARDALLNPYNLPKLPEIINTFDGAVQTDLSPQQISQLACLVPKLKPGSITFTTFPRELLTEARTFDVGVQKDVYIFKADFNNLRLFVKNFDSGVWPDPNPGNAPAATPRPRGEGSFQCP